MSTTNAKLKKPFSSWNCPIHNATGKADKFLHRLPMLRCPVRTGKRRCQEVWLQPDFIIPLCRCASLAVKKGVYRGVNGSKTQKLKCLNGCRRQLTHHFEDVYDNLLRNPRVPYEEDVEFDAKAGDYQEQVMQPADEERDHLAEFRRVRRKCDAHRAEQLLTSRDPATIPSSHASSDEVAEEICRDGYVPMECIVPRAKASRGLVPISLRVANTLNWLRWQLKIPVNCSRCGFNWNPRAPGSRRCPKCSGDPTIRRRTPPAAPGPRPRRRFRPIMSIDTNTDLLVSYPLGQDPSDALATPIQHPKALTAPLGDPPSLKVNARTTMLAAAKRGETKAQQTLRKKFKLRKWSHRRNGTEGGPATP